MNTETIFRQCCNLYFAVIIASSLLWLGISAVNTKPLIDGGISSPVLERYVILLTLIGIPVGFKMYQTLLSKYKKIHSSTPKKYFFVPFCIRLGILAGILLTNALCIHLAPINTFFLLGFITFVAFFFAMPNRDDLTHWEQSEKEEL